MSNIQYIHVVSYASFNCDQMFDCAAHFIPWTLVNKIAIDYY